jgi:hypothetical protein
MGEADRCAETGRHGQRGSEYGCANGSLWVGVRAVSRGHAKLLPASSRFAGR